MLLITLLLLSSLNLVLSSTAYYPLQSFDAISLQLPLTGQVNVSANGSYSATINAVDQLVNATSVFNNNGNLTISLNAGSSVNTKFTSAQTLSILVPAGALSAIAISSTGSLSIDGAAISPNATLYTLNTGPGSLVITNVTSNSTSSLATGDGLTVVTGTLGDAVFTSAGGGSNYLQGNISSVNVTVTGKGDLYISSGGGSSSPSIQGTASRKSSVQYDKGSCSLTGCSQTNKISLPSEITSNPKGTVKVSESTEPDATAEDTSSGEGEGGSGGTGESGSEGGSGEGGDSGGSSGGGDSGGGGGDGAAGGGGGGGGEK